MKNKNKDIDEIYLLILAYLLTIGLTIAWSVFTNK
jgi:hypothetical protein